MKTEVRIILEEAASNKAKGSCFEDLIRNVLSIHGYRIRQNLRFTGMELDLLAEHKFEKGILYVECKAKEKVTSTELRTFFANVFHHKADKGYFFRTQELEFDAGGLLREYKEDDRYKKLTFFEPEDIITLLVDSKMIFEPAHQLSKYIISKKVLAVTYFGDFLIYLINESNLYPTKFIVINAKDNFSEVGKDVVNLLRDKIDELKSLQSVTNIIQPISTEIKLREGKLIESISEVQESENWYDPLPASSKDFVGRDSIRTQILEYFKEIQNGKSQKRIFYLNGKSGWGKSSLVLEIKGRCRNKHYKNKFFAIAIDTRSATSDNFVALSFDKLIKSAYRNKFIDPSFFNHDISFTSSVDLLSSETILALLEKLKQENKFLVLIFDQFEDVFRKNDLFKSFYKFLSDVTDKKPNIIVGFSWKTEIIIPIENDAYPLWHQAKEQAREFNISEFGEKEINGIIKQLEQSIGRLDKEIKNRIRESSQGLPWLTKKLCIHIYEQIKFGGLKKDKLIESNLNIKDLFEKEKERIRPDEQKALKLIAQRGYDGNFFEVSEVGETIESGIIESLIHKRLIIKSGTNYNIYWDIFRDYLVTDHIPPIGESFLLRQGVNLCLEVFLLFKQKCDSETIESLLLKHPKKIGITTLENILIELRNIGLIQKNEEFYTIAKDNIEVSKEGFIDFVTQKFLNYTPYLVLKRLNPSLITKDEITSVLKSIFKQEYQEKTWEAYSLNLINWFLLSKLDIRDKIVEPKKGRGTKSKLLLATNNAIPRCSIMEIVSVLNSIIKPSYVIKSKYYRDLILLGIVDENRSLTKLGMEILELKKEDQIALVKSKVRANPRMAEIEKIIFTNRKIKAKELLVILPDDFFDGKKISSKLIYATAAMTWLK